MFAKLSSESGKACYAKRKQTVEPVFGQLKEHQGVHRPGPVNLAAALRRHARDPARPLTTLGIALG
jgi:hypothetical protein